MTAKLELSFNGRVVGDYELDREAFIIGRRPESDIHIDNLAVSGRHARIVTIAGSSFLEDLGSTNGTLLNGARVTKHPLADGDEVVIGKHVLRFRSGDAAAEPAEETGPSFAETIVIGPDETAALRQAATATAFTPNAAEGAAASAAGAAASGAEGRAAGVAANVGPARLKLLTDGGDGKEMRLTKALTTLGKPGIQVAAISRRQNGDFIVHVDGGENNAARPVVNGATIGVKSQLLGDRDVIEIAGVRMQYLRS